MSDELDILKDKTDNNKKVFLEALKSCLGIVSMAAKKTELSRSQHYEWLHNDPEYKKDVDDIQNIALDFAESKLHGLIDRSDVASTIFYLKTKGKNRGYVERQEQEMTFTNKPVFIDLTGNDPLDEKTSGGL